MTQAQMITVDEGTIPVKIRVDTLKSFDTKSVPSRFKQVGLEDGHYVWGYANVADETDSDGDRIEREAMAEALKTITKKPYNKLFLVHDYQTIAVGKIVHAEMDGEHPIILAKLNENLNNFQEIWKSIQEEYLDSFSIGGSFTKVVTEYDEKEDRYVNTVKELILREVSLTSIPAHPGASVLGAFKKTLELVKKAKEQTEDSTMGEENKKTTKNPEEGEQAPEGEKTQAPEGQAAEENKSEENQAQSTEETKSEGDDTKIGQVLTLLQKQNDRLDALEKKLENKDEDPEEDDEDDEDEGRDEDGDEKSANAEDNTQAAEPARKSKGSDKHKQKFANNKDNKQGENAAQKSGQFMSWLKGE